MSEKEQVYNFKWMETFTKAGLELPKTERLIFWGLLIEYGALRQEPAEFPSTKRVPSYVFKALFEGARINIDNSVKCHADGKKGGRPRKNPSADAEKKPAEIVETSTIIPADLNVDIVDEPAISGLVVLDWEEEDIEDSCPF